MTDMINVVSLETAILCVDCEVISTIRTHADRTSTSVR
jgi:hypothetical protein